MNVIKRLYYKIHYSHLKIEKDVDIIGKCYFEDHTLLNSRVVFQDSELGRYSYVNYNSIFNSTKIGRFTSIGPNVICGLGSHPTRNILSTSPAIFKKGYFSSKTLFDQASIVNIGSDTWIGANVVILNNITIGDGAIIGANAVVKTDIPPFSIYAGQPAKKIGQRFDEETVAKLIKDKWWNQPDDTIRKYINAFSEENKRKNEIKE